MDKGALDKICEKVGTKNLVLDFLQERNGTLIKASVVLFLIVVVIALIWYFIMDNVTRWILTILFGIISLILFYVMWDTQSSYRLLGSKGLYD